MIALRAGKLCTAIQVTVSTAKETASPSYVRHSELLSRADCLLGTCYRLQNYHFSCSLQLQLSSFHAFTFTGAPAFFPCYISQNLKLIFFKKNFRLSTHDPLSRCRQVHICVAGEGNSKNVKKNSKSMRLI